MPDRAPARFYTAARRIPTLIGRLADGTRLPGGPYTLGQVVMLLGTAWGLMKTTAVWAHFGGLMNLVVAIVVVAAAVWAVGKLPRTGRNPLSWVLDLLLMMLRPAGGTLDRRAMRAPRARVVTFKTVVPVLEVAPKTMPKEVPMETVVATPAVVEEAAVPLSGVGRLLAAAAARGEGQV